MSPQSAQTVSEKASLPRTVSEAGLSIIEFFHTHFGRFPDPVLVTDANSAVIFLNESAQRLTGRAVQKEIPLLLSDILRVDPDRPTGSLLEEFLDLEESFDLEKSLDKEVLDRVPVYLRDEAGNWAPFSLSARLQSGKDGNPTGCLAILRSAPQDLNSRMPAPLYSGIINNFPMPCLIVDTTLTVIYMNDHLERLTGFKKSEVVNRMTCAELLRTTQCNADDCTIKRVMENRASVSGLRRIILDREDRPIPVSVHSSMITNSEQKIIGGFLAFRDITPTVEADQKIRMLIEITQEGILMVDETNRVIYANTKMAEMLDRPKEELIGRNIQELLPFQLVKIANDLAQKVDSEHPQLLRFCSTINGTESGTETLRTDYRAFETCIIVSRIGKSLTTYMYFHDLTKHIEIERQLYKANNFLNNIIMSSADGIIVSDTNGAALIFNEAAERILGYSAGEIIGIPHALAAMYSPGLAKEIMRRMRSSPDGKLPSTRVTLVRKDGEEVPVNFSAAIIKKEEREIGSVGIFSDLREQLRMRRELDEAKVQLMQAEKIASIGRLAAGIAHEINNPLSGILIFAEVLKKEMAGDSQNSRDVQEIIDQTLRCKEIVERLLNFSRQSLGRKITIDINEVINRSTDLLSHQALFQDVEFVMDLQPDIPPMSGDPGQLQQVVTNLLINAGTAMKGKGKVLISSKFEPEFEKIVLLVQDTGSGIPSDIIVKIFEPFFTTKQPGEGTGLGLSVVYGIIQQHGGSIEAGNSPEGGAVFKITLPLECPEIQIDYTG